MLICRALLPGDIVRGFNYDMCPERQWWLARHAVRPILYHVLLSRPFHKGIYGTHIAKLMSSIYIVNIARPRNASYARVYLLQHNISTVRELIDQYTNEGSPIGSHRTTLAKEAR